MNACVHFVAEVLVPELGWITVPGEFGHPSYADSEALRFAMTWGGTDTRVQSLECDGSCTQEDN